MAMRLEKSYSSTKNLNLKEQVLTDVELVGDNSTNIEIYPKYEIGTHIGAIKINGTTQNLFIPYPDFKLNSDSMNYVANGLVTDSLNDLQKYVDNVSCHVDKFHSLLEMYTIRLEGDIKVFSENLNEKYDSALSTISDLRNQLMNVMVDVNSQMTSIQNKVDAAISSIQNNVSDAVSKQMANVLSPIKSSISDNTSKIAVVEGNVNEVKNNISNVETNVVELKNDVSKKFNSMTVAVNAVKTAANKNTSFVNAFKENVAELEKVGDKASLKKLKEVVNQIIDCLQKLA